MTTNQMQHIVSLSGGISPETREWLAWVQEACEWLIGNGGKQ
jgi:hypothetical protein